MSVTRVRAHLLAPIPTVAPEPLLFPSLSDTLLMPVRRQQVYTSSLSIRLDLGDIDCQRIRWYLSTDSRILLLCHCLVELRSNTILKGHHGADQNPPDPAL